MLSIIVVLLKQLFTTLYCPNFSNESLTLFNKLQSIQKVLLFADHSYNDVNETSVLTASIEYLHSFNKNF